MAFQISNFVIDRVRRGVMFHSSTNEILFSINQIENPALNVTSETTDAVDALGVAIATFNRAKNAEFSAESSLFDLNLLAAQNGREVEIASSTMKYNVPQFEEIKVTTAGTISVSRNPLPGTLTFVHKMNGDGTLATKYAIGDTVGATTATLSGKNISFADKEAVVGDRFFVTYEYEASDAAGQGATRVTGDAVNFPTAGKFVMEVLGVDVCDPSTLYSAYIIFPNSKLLSDFDINFATDGKHPFSMRAMQDYCDPDKVLFHIVVPEMQAAV